MRREDVRRRANCIELQSLDSLWKSRKAACVALEATSLAADGSIKPPLGRKPEFGRKSAQVWTFRMKWWTVSVGLIHMTHIHTHRRLLRLSASARVSQTLSLDFQIFFFRFRIHRRLRQLQRHLVQSGHSHLWNKLKDRAHSCSHLDQPWPTYVSQHLVL